MNPDFLEKYDCTLTVKTPVFVGSGKRLSKIEYIYEPGNGRNWHTPCDRFEKAIRVHGVQRKGNGAGRIFQQTRQL